MSKFYRYAAAVLGLWLLLWMRLFALYCRDDALIHLRYAAHLLNGHMLSYDGVHRSYGTSSLLYIVLLAGLRSLTASALLPRVLSSVAHLLLLGGTALALDRALRRCRAPRSLWLMAIALLAVLVSPSAIRWLDDGMETSLTLVFVAASVWLLRRLGDSPLPSRKLLAAIFVFGCAMELLRVELLLLAGLLTLIALLERRPLLPRPSTLAHKLRWAAPASVPLAGALTGAVLIVLSTGSLLPDTAVAKAYGASDWQSTLMMTAITFASSFSFGLGLIGLWALSAAAVVHFRRRVTAADLAANALLPAVLLLSAARGQQIQGIRYFVWTLLFPILWNLLRAAGPAPAAEPAAPLARDRGLTLATSLLLLALLAALPWESRTIGRLLAAQGQTFAAMRSANLDVLSQQLGLVEDVGYLGYFTNASICDPYGLVDGRAFARLTYPERFQACIAQHPAFVFGGDGMLQHAADSMSLTGWVICGQYRFDNIRSQGIHYLVVSPPLAQRTCNATGRQPQPVEALLH